MTATLLGLHHAPQPTAEEGRAHPVVGACRREGQHRGNLGGEFRAGPAPAAHLRRRALVHQEHDGKLAFLVMATEIGIAKAGGHAPVDRPYVITRLVLTNVEELDATPTERTGVVAGREIANEAARRQLQSPDLVGDLVRDHGTAMRSRMRSTIWSGVTPSASAR